MKFFITDETNITKDDKFEFFVYGGLVVDESEMRGMSRKVLALKKGFNIKKERPIKWGNINWKKEGVLDIEIHEKVKKEILSLVQKSNSKIIISLSPHDFYHEINFVSFKLKQNSEKYLRAQTWALNACLNKFNKYLENINKRGIVIADTFNEEHKNKITEHCFQLYPDGQDMPLNNIVYPTMQVTNEYSQIHQINDVVLGAITYSMREMTHNFMPIIKDNFWRSDIFDYNSILNKGLNIYPKNVHSTELKEKIQKLEAKFKRLIGI